jgi:hypothetical protein
MQWNYTTVLNIVFLVVTAVLVIRFLRTGGPAMLKMMSMPASEMHLSSMGSGPLLIGPRSISLSNSFLRFRSNAPESLSMRDQLLQRPR